MVHRADTTVCTTKSHMYGRGANQGDDSICYSEIINPIEYSANVIKPEDQIFVSKNKKSDVKVTVLMVRPYQIKGM